MVVSCDLMIGVLEFGQVGTARGRGDWMSEPVVCMNWTERVLGLGDQPINWSKSTYCKVTVIYVSIVSRGRFRVFPAL